MRTLVVGLALLLLLPLAPGARAGGSYSVDTTMTLVDATHVKQVNTYTYDGASTRWTLLVPPGFTFVKATNARVDSVSADQIQAQTSGSNPTTFSLEFAGAPKANGGFIELDANVAAVSDSATSARVALPAGDSLAGWYSQGQASPDAQNVFRWKGPQLVQFLVAAGPQAPDARANGTVVLREANATVAEHAAHMRLTYVYDTDVWGPDWKVALPNDAKPTAAASAFGPIPFAQQPAMLTLTTPYPFGFHLGPRAFWVDLDLAPPDPFGGGFIQENFSIAAAPGDDVRLHVALDDALTLAATHEGNAAPTRALDLRATGPLAARVSMLPALPAGQQREAVGSYVVQAPSALMPQARATAQRATELLPSASAFAGGANVSFPFYVVYTDAPVFTYEEGFYSTGANTISIRASELRNVTDGKAHIEPVSTLVHESTHALIDRHFPAFPSNLSFLHEGLSRLAETHVEAAFPSGDIFTQQGSTFFRHSARPDAKAVQDRYRSGWTFPLAWGAHGDLTDEERGFLYDASGLVWHAYEEAASPSAVALTLATLNAKDTSGMSDEQAASFLVDDMRSHAANLTLAQIVYPGAQVAAASASQFQACMGDLVAPRYPFESAGSPPPSGCGWPSSAPVQSADNASAPPSPIVAPARIRVADITLTSAAVAGSPVTILAQITNDGDSPAPAVLSFLAGGAERDRRTVQVPAHGVAKADFAFFAGDAGDVPVEVRLPDGTGAAVSVHVIAPPPASQAPGAPDASAQSPGAVAGGGPSAPGSADGASQIPGPAAPFVAFALVAAASLARRKKA